MKLLHTSDWHLGKRPIGGIGEYSDKRYNDYFEASEYIVDKAIEENVDLVVIAGDLFDSNRIDPDILDRTEQILRKLKNNEIGVVAVAGNHDNVYEKDSWIDYLSREDLLINLSFRRDGEKFGFEVLDFKGFHIYGIPYQGNLIDETLDSLSKKLSSDNNIVICHTALLNQETENTLLPGCVKGERIDLFNGKVVYFAGGHFHSFSFYPLLKPFFFVPGSPEYWDLYERDQKGYIIFDTQTLSYQFSQSKRRKRRILNTTLSSMKEYIETLEVEEGEILILKIKVDSDKFVDDREIIGKLQSKGALKVELRFEYSKNDLEEMSGYLSKELIEKQIIQKWNNVFSSTEESVARTYNFLQKLKSFNDDSDKLFELFDEFLSRIIEGEQNDN
ncbi:MAG: metallophosphoesterase family protein [Fervidobacterium sp.]|jgi:DNA repair exonuclease SbcCD nuclease subunit